MYSIENSSTRIRGVEHGDADCVSADLSETISDLDSTYKLITFIENTDYSLQGINVIRFENKLSIFDLNLTYD